MLERGLYIHIPFCATKCTYCDFYSFTPRGEIIDEYLNATIRELDKYKDYKVNTLYIGGGTPSVLGERRLGYLLDEIWKRFGSFEEATIEANPADNLLEFFKRAKKGGINRVSLGVQSAIPEELALLSRRHTNDDVLRAVADCKTAGITNISLDLMLGIPNQTQESLQKSIDFLCGLEPTHISAYILKLEKGTPLFKAKDTLNLPDEDEVSDLYLTAVKLLKERGYNQYEISNFAKNGCESKHNLLYWQGNEYIGIGASAHGYLNGKRYFYPRDIDAFLGGVSPTFDGEGGSLEEYLMLRLRLCEGVNYNTLSQRFNISCENIKAKAQVLAKHRLITATEQGFSLTPIGFLVSNSVILEILNSIE